MSEEQSPNPEAPQRPPDPPRHMEVRDASDVTQVGAVGGDMVTHREQITDIDTGPVSINIGTSVIGGALVLVALIAVLLIGSSLINRPVDNTPADVTPTLTPADIYIAELDTTNAPADSRFAMANRLEQDLTERLWQHGLSDLKVAIVPALSTAEQARVMAEAGGARILIWGWQDAGGISIRVLMVDEGVKEVPATGVLPVRGLGTPEAELAFDIAGEIPQNVSFLSLFVIGRLHYENNQYADGYAAYDAAMWSMPENVRLENRALLHFFTARSMEAAEDRDVDRIMCEYAQAIRLDRRFWEAYVNLGNILARMRNLLGYVELSPQAEECLRGVSPDSYPSAGSFYTAVLEENPDWALVRYNSLLLGWDGFAAPGGMVGDFAEVVELDPTIPGAHIALGGLALQAEDYPAALDHFNDALELVPEQFELHVNIGLLKLRAGETEAARAALDRALALEPASGEANLAMASLLIMEGELDAAGPYLEAARESLSDPMLTWETESAAEVAAVLAARLPLEAGDVPGAVAALEETASQEETPKPLTNYLLGLLYLLNEDPDSAAGMFEYLWPDPDKLQYVEKVTLLDTWAEVSTRCLRDFWTYNVEYDPLRRDPNDFRTAEIAARFAELYPRVMAWGTSANACLPLDLRERALAVFDLLQEQMLNRFYYRFVAPDPGGMACPYVFTYDADRAVWAFDTTILYMLDSPARAGAQARRLTRFDGRLRIVELEPETSYLDALELRVVDGAGRVHWLAAPDPRLAAADGQVVILTTGDQLELAFPAYAALEAPRAVWVVATGYYVPVPVAAP